MGGTITPRFFTDPLWIEPAPFRTEWAAANGACTLSSRGAPHAIASQEENSMYSAITKCEEKCCLNKSGVDSIFGSTKLPFAARGVLTLAALSALLLIAPALASAQTETVLHSFCAQSGCADGQHPEARLVLDPSGNLYGTTDLGGANALGTVFEVTVSGIESVLYSFCAQEDCKDGYHPRAGLILDAEGNLYGGIYDGGTHDGGVVAEFSPTGAETVLYNFCSERGCQDGYYPHADLIMDKSGNLYGTTQYRGAYGGGNVFEVSSNGTESVIYGFCQQSGCTDGNAPKAGLALDAKGNLYGTTYKGGAHGEGVVFEITPGGTETVLYSFCGQANCTDGSEPEADLILDKNGNLYGTTYGGGANGKGTVFEVSPSGVETVLYSFCPQTGCKDGARPEAGLVMDAKGNLYGTTYSGGGNKRRGTVFEVTPSGTETVLHAFFAKGTDGYNPSASLVMDAKGTLYGTTLHGGAYGGGTVFQVVP